MRLFFDTSAVIPLLLQEHHSALSVQLWANTTEAWCWRWLTMEADAALTRQDADTETWQRWRSLEAHFSVVDFGADQNAALRSYNRNLGLRAMDAGHLFVFDRMLSALHDLYLVSLDREMVEAAHALRLPVHPDLP